MAYTPLQRECIDTEQRVYALIQTVCDDKNMPFLASTRAGNLTDMHSALAFQTTGAESSPERAADMKLQLGMIGDWFKGTMRVAQQHSDPTSEIIIASVVVSCSFLLTDTTQIGGHVIVQYSTFYTERTPAEPPVAHTGFSFSTVPSVSSVVSTPLVRPEPITGKTLRATARSQTIKRILERVQDAASNGMLTATFDLLPVIDDDVLRTLRDKGLTVLKKPADHKLIVGWESPA